MLKETKETVILPDGRKVRISDPTERWLTQDDATGYLDPRLLAHDPDQCRQEMGSVKLAELEASVAECGVKEIITITPRSHAPWVRVRPQDEHLLHVIVSGHRRDLAAIKGNVAAVPVRVRIYPNEEAHRTDGGVLNACRDDLSELEQGFEFLREMKTGKKVPQIAAAHGINVLTATNRINLTRLHPSLFPLLRPQSNGKRLLPIYPASILGGLKAPLSKELDELATRFGDIVDVADATGHESFDALSDDERRFALQRLLVQVILTRQLNSVRAAEFIRDRTLKFNPHRHGIDKMERYQPARRKEMLANLSNSVSGSAIIDWTHEEFRRIFGLSSREDVETYLRNAEAARDVMAGIIKILTGIRDSKRPTPSEVQKYLKPKEKV